MQVQTDVKLKDYLEFNWYHHRKSRTTQAMRWLVLIPGGLLSFLCIFALVRSANPLKTAMDIKPLLYGVVLPFFLYAFCWKYIIFLILKLNLREGKNKDVFGAREITIGPEGIAETSSTRTNSTTWASVEKIIDLPDVTYIYVSAMGAHIIPQRSFASDGQYREFIDRTKSYLNQDNSR